MMEKEEMTTCFTVPVLPSIPTCQKRMCPWVINYIGCDYSTIWLFLIFTYVEIGSKELKKYNI